MATEGDQTPVALVEVAPDPKQSRRGFVYKAGALIFVAVLADLIPGHAMAVNNCGNGNPDSNCNSTTNSGQVHASDGNCGTASNNSIDSSCGTSSDLTGDKNSDASCGAGGPYATHNDANA